MSSATTTAELDTGTGQLGSQGAESFAVVLKKLFGKNSSAIALIIGAAAVAVIAALFMWANSTEYRVLFSNLSEADGGRIISELDKRTIPYRLSSGGQAIMVPADQVDTLRLQLAEQGLPNGSGIGFEVMDQQAFGISQFAEQINFQRGLEGELVRSIKSLGPVSDARIHLALAKESVFVREREPAKASVLVTLHPGRTLDPGQVNAIMHLVSSSVAGLTTENISVVDQAGQLLSDSDVRSGLLESNQLNHILDVESSYQKRIENTLAPLFGKENFTVQVTAQIDFSQREETSERYAPNQDPKEAAVRSAQWSTNIDGSNIKGLGVPGALSNTPPRPNNTQADNGDETTSPAAGISGNLQQANTINYEVDRNIVHIQHQTARIQRLTTAVVINYRQTVDEEGKPSSEPLNNEELDEVTLLIKQAMGFSEQRGDQVQVVNSRFTPAKAIIEPEKPPFWKTPEGFDLIITLTRYLAALIGAFVVYKIVLGPLLKKHLSDSTSHGHSTQATESDLEQVSITPPEAMRRSMAGRKMKASTYEQNVEELRQVAKEDPRLIAMILRSWMNKQ